MISLLSIVTKHGCSDELLYDLIKRERVIHPSSEYPPPFAEKKLIPDLAKSYIRSHQIYENGQLIRLRFLKQIRAVVYRNLKQIFEYNSKRDSTSDMTLQSLVKDNKIKIKLILNTDDAVVQKSACESASPVCLAIADLPLFCAQSLKILSCVVCGMEIVIVLGMKFLDFIKRNSSISANWSSEILLSQSSSKLLF